MFESTSLSRKKWMAAVLLMATVWISLEAYLTYLKEKHAPLDRLVSNGGIRGVAAWADFHYGADLFRDGVSIAEACRELGDESGLCLNGYLTEMAKSSDAAKFEPGFTRYRDLWLFSTGMAMAEMGRDLKGETQSREEAIRIEGWAFQNVRMHGLKESLADCGRRFNGFQYSVCLFGLGRGSFFWREDWAAITVPPDHMKSGYLFAQGLFGSQADDKKFSTPMGRAGRAVRQMFLGQANKVGPELRKCLTVHHPLQCDSALWNESH